VSGLGRYDLCLGRCHVLNTSEVYTGCNAFGCVSSLGGRCNFINTNQVYSDCNAFGCVSSLGGRCNFINANQVYSVCNAFGCVSLFDFCTVMSQPCIRQDRSARSIVLAWNGQNRLFTFQMMLCACGLILLPSVDVLCTYTEIRAYKAIVNKIVVWCLTVGLFTRTKSEYELSSDLVHLVLFVRHLLYTWLNFLLTSC